MALVLRHTMGGMGRVLDGGHDRGASGQLRLRLVGEAVTDTERQTRQLGHGRQCTGSPHAVTRGGRQPMIASIGVPWSIASRLRPGTSSFRESRPSCLRIVAWMSVT